MSRCLGKTLLLRFRACAVPSCVHSGVESFRGFQLTMLFMGEGTIMLTIGQGFNVERLKRLLLADECIALERTK